MLSSEAKKRSFSSVRSFAEASGGSPDSFYRRVDVMVCHGQEKYLYQEIYMSISYQYKYMDYKVDLVWEDDATQPDYEDIGLHGGYSTNFQEFSFSGDELSFTDGGNQVSIFVGDADD